MAGNRDIKVARAFHDMTAHSPASVRTSGHTLEWDIKPFPFKVYTDRSAIALPRAFDPVELDTLRALDPSTAVPAHDLTLDRLAALLYLSAGVTKKKTYPGGGEALFRAAASTGALYQTEAYVVTGAIEGLAAGVYHFNPGDFALRQLREGDVRASLAEAAADPAIARRAATTVLTAIFWRNTWKYQARGWRHLYWDSGTMLSNLTAVGHALGLAPRVVAGFVDDDVNGLLGIDHEREAGLELVAVGRDTAPVPAPARLDEIRHETLPLSSEDVDYPTLREMQQASALASPSEVASWRSAAAPPPREPDGELRRLPVPRVAAGRGLGETIQHRGSSRRFTQAPLTAEELGTTLWWATRPLAADVPWGLVDPFLIVNAVDGIASGAYRYARELHALELLRAGDFRRESAYLCLEQPLGGDAAATLYFLAPLTALLAAFGNRGYRLANLEAGVIGGRAYLTAYAQRFGATGLTFYDGKVVEFFAPASRGLDAIFVTALGHGARAPW